MWRLVYLLLQQRLRSRAVAPRRRGLLGVALGALLVGLAAAALAPAWRAHDEAAVVAAVTPTERATLRLRIAAVDSPPLVVFLDSGATDPIGAADDAAPAVRLTSIGGVFEPAFQVAPLASRVEIGNADPTAHNTHLFDSRRRTLFNVALPEQGVPVTRVLGRSGLFEVRCDMHAWMRAAVFVPPNAHHAVLRGGGEVLFRDVPAGRHTLHVWTAARGERVQGVELAPGATTTLELAAR